MQKASVFVSVLTLTAISIERWMAICQPFMFRQTAVRARRIIAVVWLLSLACAVPDLVGMTLHFTPYGLMCQPSWPHEAEELHLLLIFVLFYLVPLVIMTFTYVRVALCLWRSGSMSDTDGGLLCCGLGESMRFEPLWGSLRVTAGFEPGWVGGGRVNSGGLGFGLSGVTAGVFR